MFENLQTAEEKYDEIHKKLSNSDVISDQQQYKKLLKELKDLEEVVLKYREYKKTIDEITSTQELLFQDSDKEFKEIAEEELFQLNKNLEKIEKEIKLLLIPKDPNDDKNVIVEIRGGAGGEESALFAAVLFRMYVRYAELNRWKTDILSSNPTEIGGFKEITFSISGNGVYSKLKFESGVHRVQRIPTTEANGRIHTSTVTVAVLPEVEEVDIDINPSDLRIDTYRSSGAGGQHVNKTDSAIRITHLQTGIVVACQDQRSQLKNKEKAMRILRAKLHESEQEKINNELAASRRNQVGTGDRSERIRTYNYPQGRVTDHRISLTLYKLDQLFDGDMDELINSLIAEDRARALSSYETKN